MAAARAPGAAGEDGDGAGDEATGVGDEAAGLGVGAGLTAGAAAGAAAATGVGLAVGVEVGVGVAGGGAGSNRTSSTTSIPKAAPAGRSTSRAFADRAFAGACSAPVLVSTSDSAGLRTAGASAVESCVPLPSAEAYQATRNQTRSPGEAGRMRALARYQPPAVTCTVCDIHFVEALCDVRTAASPLSLKPSAAVRMPPTLDHPSMPSAKSPLVSRSKIGTGAFSFKKNWGFTPEPWTYEYKLRNIDHIPDINPLNPKYRLFIAAWKRLPVPIANLIGPYIVRGLG